MQGLSVNGGLNPGEILWMRIDSYPTIAGKTSDKAQHGRIFGFAHEGKG
jgi:hypothetical protein